MENRFINATHDFTEVDKVQLEWLRRKESRQVRGELIRAGKVTAKMAVKDVAFLMACAAFVAVVVVVCVAIVNK